MVNAMRPSVIHWPLLGSLGPRPMYRRNPPLIGPASTYRIRIIRYLTLNFIWNNSSHYRYYPSGWVGQSAILVIMYVKAFKTDIIVFISNIIMSLMLH